MAAALPNIEGQLVAEKIAKVQAVVVALFYHLQKNKMDTRDGLLVLSSAFSAIRASQPTIDQQTELKILFLSMIENLPDATPPPSPIIKP